MSHDETSIEDLLFATLDAVSRFRVGQREAIGAGKDKARRELGQTYDRDYHKFEDCPWTGVNDPMCWLCFRYTMGFKDANTDRDTCLANGVPPNDSPLLQSVLRRHGAWALNLELAKWEGGGYPDREGHIRDCQGAGCGATCGCPCHAGELRG